MHGINILKICMISEKKMVDLARQAALLTKREDRVLFEPGSEARMALV